MLKDLKKLADELETILDQKSSLIDAPVREQFRARIEALKRGLDQASAEDLARRRGEGLKIFAALLSIITNLIDLMP